MFMNNIETEIIHEKNHFNKRHHQLNVCENMRLENLKKNHNKKNQELKNIEGMIKLLKSSMTLSKDILKILEIEMKNHE